MSYTIDIVLDPIIVQALEEIGKSDTIESNICEILTQYIKIRYRKLCEKNLRAQQKFIVDQVKINKISKDNVNLETLHFTPKKNKVKNEENKLLEIFNALNLFKEGKFTANDLERYKEEFITLNLKSNEEKKIAQIKQRHHHKKIQTINILNKDALNTEFRYREEKSFVRKELAILTTENILANLSNEWQTTKDLIFKLKIKQMMDARFLQVKLKKLENDDLIEMQVKLGIKQWRLKSQ